MRIASCLARSHGAAGPARALLRHAAGSGWCGSAVVRRWMATALVLQVVVFAVLLAGTHGWIAPLDHPVSMDFVSFYAAGRLADQGQAVLAYSREAHFAAEQAVLGKGIEYQYFLYPPPFLLVCALLGQLPWVAAFLAFQAASLLGCLAALRATLDLPWRRCLVPLLAFPALPWVLLLGQNAFLTAGLFTWALLLLERHPVLAGLLAAGLACKPHYALLIPLAFAAGGYWRAFAAATLGTFALCAGATLVFGTGIWPAYLGYFAACQPDLQAGLVGRFGAMVSPYGALRAAGGSHAAAALLQAVALAVSATVVALLWRRGAALPLRAAALLAGAMVAAPMSLFYDLMFALAALCWLVRHGRKEGFPPWSASVMVACWLLPAAALALGDRHVPVGGLVAPALLGMCWVWARGEQARRASCRGAFRADAGNLSPV